MRTVGEIAEDHEQVGAAPHRWIFRTDELVQLRFRLARESFQGTPALLLQGWSDRESTCFPVTVEEIDGVATLTAELKLDEGYYVYRIAWQGRCGFTRTSAPRFIAVSNSIPRTMSDIPLLTSNLAPDSARKAISTKRETGSGLIYSLILDRFAIGEQGSPIVEDLFLQRHSPFGRHGGNLSGLKQRLDYLVGLGVSTILLNPVYLNENLLYHGYHPLSLFMVDPLIGTASELKALVQAAHNRGMKVMIDVVCNHLGDLIDWDGGAPAFKYFGADADTSKPEWGPQTVQRRDRAFSTATLLPYPEEARSVARFHGTQYQDPIRCRLFGLLEDWRTEDHDVKRMLIEHVKYLVSEFDFDGVRYDAVRHVEPDFWRLCIGEVTQLARQLGKDSFSQVAEHAGATEADFLPWREAGFRSMLQFPLHDYLRDSLTKGHGVIRFVEYLCSDGWKAEIGAKPDDYLFLDSHDRTRLLHDVRQAFGPDASAAFQVCLTTLLLGQLTPVIYYGTEQEFEGALGTYWNPATGATIGHDCYVREDMFPNQDCLWLMGELNNPKFEPYCDSTPSYKVVSWLAMKRQCLNVLDPIYLASDNPNVSCVAFAGVKPGEYWAIAVNSSGDTEQGRLRLPMHVESVRQDQSPFLRGGEATLKAGAMEYTIEALGILPVTLTREAGGVH